MRSTSRHGRDGVRVDPRKENGRAPTRSLDPRLIKSLQVGDWLEMLTTLVYAASAPKQLLYLTLPPAALHPMAIGVIAGIVLARGQSGPGAALCYGTAPVVLAGLAAR